MRRTDPVLRGTFYVQQITATVVQENTVVDGSGMEHRELGYLHQVVQRSRQGSMQETVLCRLQTRHEVIGLGNQIVRFLHGHIGLRELDDEHLRSSLV